MIFFIFGIKINYLGRKVKELIYGPLIIFKTGIIFEPRTYLGSIQRLRNFFFYCGKSQTLNKKSIKLKSTSDREALGGPLARSEVVFWR